MSSIFEEIVPGVCIDEGSCLAAILLADGFALVVNPGNPGLAERLREAGVERVEQVLFTHHRRELADGLPELAAAWQPEVVAPAGERALFETPQAYWRDPNTRWRLLCGHVPYHVTHIRPVPVSRAVAEGDAWEWRGWRIETVATPGYTDGAVSYVVRREGVAVAFCGDLICAPGMVRDFYCLQHGNAQNGHAVGDYHGFLGSMETVLASLRRLPLDECAALVPAHGVAMAGAREAVDLLDERFRAAYRNYASVSALRWYFPQYFAHLAGQVEMLARAGDRNPARERRPCVVHDLGAGGREPAGTAHRRLRSQRSGRGNGAGRGGPDRGLRRHLGDALPPRPCGDPRRGQRRAGLSGADGPGDGAHPGVSAGLVPHLSLAPRRAGGPAHRRRRDLALGRTTR